MPHLRVEQSSYVEPLLSGITTAGGSKKRAALKWFLKIVMWLVFISWLVFIFLSPLDYAETLVKEWSQETMETPLGVEGAMFMLFSSPVIVLALLSVPFLLISGEEDEMMKEKMNDRKHKPRWRLWTFPVVVNGPLGVVSAAELIGIMMFLAYLTWSAFLSIYQNLLYVQSLGLDLEQSVLSMMEYNSIAVAKAGLFCWSFLWLPIARGSLLLQLIDISMAIHWHCLFPRSCPSYYRPFNLGNFISSNEEATFRAILLYPPSLHCLCYLLGFACGCSDYQYNHRRNFPFHA